MIEVEKIPFGENISVAKVQEKIDEFSIDDVSIYTIFDIANNISCVRFNRLFDLPGSLMIPNGRF